MTDDTTIKLIDTLSASRCACVDNTHTSRRHIFEIAAKLSADTINDEQIRYQHILRYLQEREKLGSTAMGRGIAIPHARIPELKQPLSVLLKCDTPIQYSDTHAVDLVFALLVPEDAPEEHLQLLAQIAKLLQQKAVSDALRQADSSETLFATMTTALQT